MEYTASPFDELIQKLSARRLSTSVDELILLFSRTLRTIFLRMKDATAVFYPNLIENFISNDESTEQKVRGTNQLVDASIERTLSYFEFIEQINRFSVGFFKLNNKLKLPRAARIKFFRNKIIEHWTDYFKEVTTQTNVQQGINGEIMIPYHSVCRHIPSKEPEGRKNLLMVFQRHEKALAIEEYLSHSDYSELIFSALEKFDNDLKCIPESVTKALLGYSFPTPVCDVEAYIEELIKYLKSLS